MMTELLSAAEAARILGVSRGRVVELATSDPGFPPSQPSPAGGRAWPRVAVQAWAAAHPDRGPLHGGPSVPEVGGRSAAVWRVANLAGEEAQARNHTWIGPEHLLAALVHPDCPGTARAVLASLGITAERLRQAHERSFIDPFEPTTGWRTVNPAFQLVLERANLEAVLLADPEVTSEHVLLALASQWAAHATATAPPRGDLDPAAVRRRVLDVTEGVAVPPPPAPAPPLDPEETMGRVAPGWSWLRPPTARTRAAGCRGAREPSSTPTAHRSSGPTAWRCGSISLTVTATRCSPATGNRSTASSMSTAKMCWPRTAGPGSSQSKSPRDHAWNHTHAALDRHGSLVTIAGQPVRERGRRPVGGQRRRVHLLQRSPLAMRPLLRPTRPQRRRRPRPTARPEPEPRRAGVPGGATPRRIGYMKTARGPEVATGRDAARSSAMGRQGCRPPDGMSVTNDTACRCFPTQTSRIRAATRPFATHNNPRVVTELRR